VKTDPYVPTPISFPLLHPKDPLLSLDEGLEDCLGENMFSTVAAVHVVDDGAAVDGVNLVDGDTSIWESDVDRSFTKLHLVDLQLLIEDGRRRR